MKIFEAVFRRLRAKMRSVSRNGPLTMVSMMGYILSLLIFSGILNAQTIPAHPSEKKAAPAAKKTDAKAQAIPTKPSVKKPEVKVQPPRNNALLPAKTPVNTKLSRLIDAVQKQYNNTKSATFNFEQLYKHPFLKVTETSKGSVSYSRIGGKMLWSYLEPKDKQKRFYIDGTKFTYYSVRDKTAYTHNCYGQDTLSAAVAFLLGTGNLKESFTISLLEGELPNPALTWLTLLPKESNSPVKKLFLGVKDGRVMESRVEDLSDGINHFKYSNLKINPAINNKVFIFSEPNVLLQPMPGVECPDKINKTPTKNIPTKKRPVQSK